MKGKILTIRVPRRARKPRIGRLALPRNKTEAPRSTKPREEAGSGG